MNGALIWILQQQQNLSRAMQKRQHFAHAWNNKDRSWVSPLPFIRIIRVWGHKEIFSKVVVFIVAHTLLDWLKSPLDLRVSIIFNATFFYLSAILVNDSRGFAEITFKDLSFAAAIIIIDLFMIFWRSNCCFVYLVWNIISKNDVSCSYGVLGLKNSVKQHHINVIT